MYIELHNNVLIINYYVKVMYVKLHIIVLIRVLKTKKGFYSDDLEPL